MRCTTSGPADPEQLQSDLQHADVRARGSRPARLPASGSDTSRATIERVLRPRDHVVAGSRGARPASGAARGDRPGDAKPLLLQVVRDAARHLDGRRRIDQRRGADLHGPRAGEQHLDGVLPVRTPPTATIGMSGIARATSNTARSVNGLSAGPESQPATGPSVGRSAAASTPIAGGEPEHGEPVRARADGAAWRARRLRGDEGSFAKTGTIDIRATAPDDLRRAVGVRAQDLCSSSSSRSRQPNLDAPRSRVALQQARQPDVLLERVPPRWTRPRPAPPRTQRGSSSAMNASMPGFCSPGRPT